MWGVATRLRRWQWFAVVLITGRALPLLVELLPFSAGSSIGRMAASCLLRKAWATEAAMLISVFYGRIRHGDRWATWQTWIDLAHEGVAVVWWTLTAGLVAVLFQQNWLSIGGGALIR